MKATCRQASGVEPTLGKALRCSRRVCSLRRDEPEVQTEQCMRLCWGERRTPEKVCSLHGDSISTSQPHKGLLQKVQFLSLHLRSNMCVSQVCFPCLKALFLPGILLSIGYSGRSTLFSATPVMSAGCRGLLLSQLTCQTHFFVWKHILQPPLVLLKFRVSVLYSVRTFF